MEAFVNDPYEFLARNPSLMYAIGAGLVIAVVFLVLGLRMLRKRPEPELPLEKITGANAPGWAVGTAPPKTLGDKRSFARREGKAIRVVMVKADESEEIGKGFIIDRSAGGICVQSPFSLPVGTHVNVRPCDIPQVLPYLLMEVRSCRPEGTEFQIGCMYLKMPSWNISMHLG